jgi:hypothetical protein
MKPLSNYDSMDAVYRKCCCGADNCKGKFFNMYVLVFMYKYIIFTKLSLSLELEENYDMNSLG